MSSPRRSKRLLFDIETSPLVTYSWRIGRKITLSPENIKEPSNIICIAWKWEGNSTVESLTWSKAHSSKRMLQRFVPIMHSADEIITHNGDKFDVPWIRTQCLLNEVPMCPTFTSIDTLKGCRRLFRFNSNRLDYVAQELGVGKKRPTGGLELWKRVMDNNPDALAKMVRYCEHDVRLLARVFAKLNPYMPAKTHRGRYMNECPECADRMIVNGHKVSAAGTRMTKLVCKGCGKYHTVAASRLMKEVG